MRVISAMPYIFLSPHLPLDTLRRYQTGLRNTAIQVLTALYERRVVAR